ncbi:MAG: lipid asymmetry maintenance ABC transporter permease subunit MlaE [Porticoccaceae bacterium]
MSVVLTSATNRIRRLGGWVTGNIITLGLAARFFVALLAASGTCLRRPGLVVREMYFIGVMSLVIILVSGLFVGLVLGLQMYDTLQRFGSGDIVGTVVALALVRELGPVLSALLISSRAGSAVTAEIGLMKTTEQLSALEMMAIHPVARVVAPRFWAGVLSVPLLTSIFNVVGIFGGYLVAVLLLGVDSGTFWSQMQAAVDFRVDVVNGVIKSLFFGVAIIFISVFQGYHATPTAVGVSRATTQTVVVSALVVLGMDFVLTAFMFRGI